MPTLAGAFACGILTTILLGAQGALLQSQGSFTSVLTFAVTDGREDIRIDIGRDLILHVRRAVDADGRHFGWDFTVGDRRLANSPNYFYECLCGHGPRSHDLYAWHFAEAYFSAERILPIYGYPFEVRVRCIDCEIAGEEGTEVRFTAGTIDVSLRRLPVANPRQRRISDLAAP